MLRGIVLYDIPDKLTVGEPGLTTVNGKAVFFQDAPDDFVRLIPIPAVNVYPPGFLVNVYFPNHLRNNRWIPIPYLLRIMQAGGLGQRG